ncbi:type I restriction-modification system, specificity subunit S [Trabulsiella guamensis ATCC 49490]|uniref:Type I restriction-modification system, specificity subunit S n=1 Tax=Trabulsiella guamensis ATCC 49490 TaxID=1005994 RepID=A0A085AA30_9ENTR|nr:restriction endonuclease subunit S [Trabulsiella guamensis]KFC07075.1 type I restriction-modification system, specificity subunit S [Trabulsiella guamensis ATCC 49490]
MSVAGYLEKLLNGAEIEWMALENVVELKRGRRLVKSQLESEGKFAVYQNSMTPLGYYHQSNTNPDTTFIICAGAAGEIGYSSSPFWAADDVYYVASVDLLNNKFLYHYLLSQKNKILSQVRRASIPRLSKTALDKLYVPVPCPNNSEKSFAIQSEIVRILDAFTALTAELTAELNARQKQYNYYRDLLLTFDGQSGSRAVGQVEVKWKMLREIGEFIRGKRFTKADYADNGVSVIHYGDIYTKYGISTTQALNRVRADMASSLRYAQPGDIIITDVGETVEDVGKAVAWLGNNKVAIHDHCYAFRHTMNPKFVSYYMQTTSFIAEKAKYIARTKVKTLLVNNYSKIAIPVPPVEEQDRIVTILDKFDALTNSITVGLPREIELRQKQYEYYRDMLLSFPQPEQDVTTGA